MTDDSFADPAPTEPGDNDTTSPATELVISRVFDAPRELVYRAFTDPDQLALWFGPVGFTVPRDTVDLDVRVGGHQRFVMVGDDNPGWRSPVDITFTAVVENELLVGTEEFQGMPGVQPPTSMSMRLEFRDEPGGRTRLIITQGPYTRAGAQMAQAGWESSFTRLDPLLAR